jgi:hypothetical protein
MGFGYGGYYIGDDRYGHVGHQQDRRALGQENQIVQNVELNHLISLKIVVALVHHHEQGAPKDGSFADELG